MEENPFSRGKLVQLFKVSPKQPDRLIKREDSNVEFKESYNNGSMASYFRAIAAFANKNGGYIIFGVGDSPRTLNGLSKKSLEQFEELKVELFTKNLCEYFSPEINWEHVTYEFRNKSFGIIYTHELVEKPAICKKTYDSRDDKYSLKEGDIYYRYSGRSEKIRYSELRKIIEYRRNEEQKLWLKTLAKIAKIGVSNAGILDITKGTLQGKAGTVLIDKDLLSQIAFIREGEFVEKQGKPTLKLIGNVQPTNLNTIVVSKERIKVKGITDTDIVDAFLLNKKVDEPLDYIRQICHCTSGFFPIYYYINLAGISVEKTIEVISQVNVRNPAKKKLIERLSECKSEYVPLSLPKTKGSKLRHSAVSTFLSEQVPDEIAKDEIIYYVQSIKSLTKEQLVFHRDYICSKLLSLYRKYYSNATQALADDFRRAICRVDEALYMQDKKNT